MVRTVIKATITRSGSCDHKSCVRVAECKPQLHFFVEYLANHAFVVFGAKQGSNDRISLTRHCFALILSLSLCALHILFEIKHNKGDQTSARCTSTCCVCFCVEGESICSTSPNLLSPLFISSTSLLPSPSASLQASE